MKSIFKTIIKNHRRAFILFISAISMIVAAVILVQSVILFFIYRDNALTIENISVKSNLAQTSYSLDYLTATARSIAIQLYLDKEIQPALMQYLGRVLSVVESVVLKGRMSQYVETMPGIDSIYVFNSYTDMFYCVNADRSYFTSNTGDIVDTGAVELIQNVKNSRQIIARQRRLPGGYNGEYRYRGVFSYIISSVSLGHDSVYGSVIINIKEQWLVDLINSMYEDENDSKLFVIDSMGRIVAGNEYGAFFTDLSQEHYIRRIMSGDATGYFIDTINGEEYVITYVKHDELDFTLIKLTPIELIEQNSLTIRDTTIFISLMVLTFGLITIAALFWSIYKPFTGLFISRDKQEAFKRRKLLITKNRQLMNFLTSGGSTDYWRKQFEELGIKLNPDAKLTLVNFKIDNFAEFIDIYPEKDRAVMLFAIGNIADEVLSSKFKSEPVSTGEDHVTVITEADSAEIPRQMLSEAQNFIRKNLDISITVTVSHTIDNINDITFSFDELLEMSEYRFTLGHDAIITPETIPDKSEFRYENQYHREQDFLSSLAMNKIENAKLVYFEIAESLKSSSPTECLAILTHLSIVFGRAAKNMPIKTDINSLFILSNFITDLSAKETLAEVNEMFIGTLDKLQKNSINRASMSVNKHENLVNDIKTYIKDNYHDSNLSITGIADHFDISSVYLSRLFKKYTFMSIPEAINQTRSDAARELLETDGRHIGNVYKKVGFVNKSHFYTFFKKNTGMTPGEYSILVSKLK